VHDLRWLTAGRKITARDTGIRRPARAAAHLRQLLTRMANNYQ
jgi:hypothetical protein